jgi:orotate phosphoribosyltransferase
MTMSETEIQDVFRRLGALRSGHFLLASGLHSPAYVQCARLLEHPRETGPLLRVVADRWKDAGIQAVVGPAYGGILVAYALADALGVRAMYAERVEGKLALRRGFDVSGGLRVLVGEDVVTTGGSALETVDLLQSLGAQVAGVASLIDRTGGKSPFPVPFTPLLRIDLPAMPPAECPLCKQGIPLETPGRKQLKA